MIAALFVKRGGPYFDLPGVEPWALPERDAREYRGPYPVVAHPPCSRWCKLAWLVEHRWGHKRGDDGGTFAAALDAVRRWGGVLEHPAHSLAFAAFNIAPPSRGGWQRTLCGGWVAHVEQGRYGHPARKETWLYAYGVDPVPLDHREAASGALVSWCANETRQGDARARVGKDVASRTPPAFRDLLISIARNAI